MPCFKAALRCYPRFYVLERAKGFEHSTPTLARLRSTLPVLGRRISHRTEAEHVATILLPNPAGADAGRHMTDQVVKISI